MCIGALQSETGACQHVIRAFYSSAPTLCTLHLIPSRLTMAVLDIPNVDTYNLGQAQRGVTHVCKAFIRLAHSNQMHSLYSKLKFHSLLLQGPL